MKATKKTIFSLFFILCLMLSSCNSTDKEHELLKHEWAIEVISDYDGNVLKSNLKYSDSMDHYDMVLTFDKDTFLLSDNTNSEEWGGRYTIEKVGSGSSYKIDLYCEDSETVITGVYGIRKYDDKTEVQSITLQTEDKILSFIEKE